MVPVRSGAHVGGSAGQSPHARAPTTGNGGPTSITTPRSLTTMKKHLLPFTLATAGLIAANALMAQPDAVPSTPAPIPPSSKNPAAVPPTPPPDAPLPANKLPPSLKEEKEREKALENHILPMDLIVMDQPPPAPRQETRPAAPAANYKWRPGHWAAVDKKWSWVAGEWVVPPDPVAVWIDGKYDATTQKWTAPYWQPDRPTNYDKDAAPAKDAVTPKKF